ncbi:MAG: hypothetical protein E7279_10265 [Lachnospiraceae bacterium]|nr:hypothetical protein [Lachnospiraceae bacterium]
MQYDFVFVYEVKNRELESIVLLKYELEKRGYTVSLVETWEGEIHFLKPVSARVLVAFALYNNGTLKYVSSFVKDCHKFINLQWEQIYSNADVKCDNIMQNSSYEIKGEAKNVIHVSWGKNNYDRLIQKYGVDPNNIILVGNISLDFLRREFDEFYLTREELLSKYNIFQKKVYLFISTLSYTNMPEAIINSELYQNIGYDLNEFVEINIKTQKILIEWFENEIKKHPDILLIYRPHPSEAKSRLLTSFEKKYSNFRVIGDLSIKQWILRVDKIYTWYSTTVAEIYMANKGCEIIRPIPIPWDIELENYNEAKITNSFKVFDEGFEDCNPDYPIPEETIKKFYYIDEIPTYLKLADCCEKVLNSDQYCLDSPLTQAKGVHKRSFYIKRKITCLKGGISLGMHRFFGKPISDKKKKNVEELIEYKYAKKMASENAATKREINEILKKIDFCLRRNK